MILIKLLKQLFAGRSVESIDDSLATARSALAANDLVALDHAAKTVLTLQPDHAEASFYCGLVALNAGRNAEALAAFHTAEAQGATNAELAYHTALCHYALGNMASAQTYCETALKESSDFVKAHHLQAVIALPGPQYAQVLSEIHQHLKPATYLEIGVFQGRSLVLADASTAAIGIDPAPDIRVTLGKNARIHAMTSDTIFNQHDVLAEFGGRRIEMAFIDGMHHFDFALRDFAHIERNCARSAIVLIHDCYPLDRKTAERDRITTFWSGDVWRLILALKKYRPDLEIHTIATHPTGLALIRNLDPDSRVLSEKMDAIVAELSATEYGVLDANKREMLNWFPNDWTKIQGLLKPPAGNLHKDIAIVHL